MECATQELAVIFQISNRSRCKFFFDKGKALVKHAALRRKMLS